MKLRDAAATTFFFFRRPNTQIYVNLITKIILFFSSFLRYAVEFYSDVMCNEAITTVFAKMINPLLNLSAGATILSLC